MPYLGNEDISRYIPNDPRDRIWDILVIGTGAGGGPTGLSAARLGGSVLFLDRATVSETAGYSVPNDPPWNSYPGYVDPDCRESDRKAEFGNTAPEVIVGNVIGGGTGSFAMVMDRFRPMDLRLGSLSKIPESVALPDRWPVQYEELEPYFQEAESLFRVRGTDDPLYPTHAQLLEPPPPSHVEMSLHDELTRCGLHPYRIHYAREDVPGCDGCLGKLCPRDCRNSAVRACVLPALKRHGAHILPSCRVLRLNTNGGAAVREAICLWKGQQLAIRARTFVLALNALLTPALLLRSANTTSPDGLGNSSGLVGRNLMMHVSDTLLVNFKSQRGQINPELRHGISLNDFYVKDGVKLGNIHMHSFDISRVIGESAQKRNAQSVACFMTIVEDYPYAGNRVILEAGNGDSVRWEYKYPDELRARSRLLIDAFRTYLTPVGDLSILGTHGLLNGSHVCGTCRSGNDPRMSVLDRNNRVHNLDNVYVVDASFFPSSGGINPSLTIAANALRVGRLIV